MAPFSPRDGAADSTRDRIGCSWLNGSRSYTSPPSCDSIDAQQVRGQSGTITAVVNALAKGRIERGQNGSRGSLVSQRSADRSRRPEPSERGWVRGVCAWMGPIRPPVSVGQHKMKRLLLAFITLAAPTALTAPAFAGLKDAMNKALSARRRAASGSRRKTNAGLRKSRLPGLRLAYAIPPARAPTKVDAPVVSCTQLRSQHPDKRSSDEHGCSTT